MQIHQQGDHWVIAQQLSSQATSGVSGGRGLGANRTQDNYAAWTGKRWGWQRSGALSFATREEAQQYLNENRDRMA